MIVLAMVRKDLRRIFSDRKALVVNLVLPLLLTFIMGLSFGGGFFGDTGISAIPLVLVGEEVPTLLRDRIGEALAETGFFAAEWADSSGAERRVREGDAAAALVLPGDFADRFFGGREVVLTVWKDPGSPFKAGIVVQILERALGRYQAGEAAYRALWPEDALAGPGLPDGLTWEEFTAGGFTGAWQRWRANRGDPAYRELGDRFLRNMDHQAALGRALEKDRIALQVHDRAAARPGAEAEANLFDYFLPSFAVFFLMFGVAAGTRDLLRERERGTLQRQLLAPVSGLQLLLGKWLAASLQGIIQLMVLFLAGAALFRVNLGPDAWSLITLIVLSCTAAAGVFLLMALLSRTERIMDNLSTIVILVSAMIGGNMMPIESLPSWVHVCGRFVFNYWANLGFSNVVAGNSSLAAAPQPALVLAGVTVLTLLLNLFVLAVRQRRGGLA